MTTGRLPDFIIGGAMKAGTTSLHRTLAQRADVFIPAGEVSFFDVDDVVQNPDFLSVGPDGASRDLDPLAAPNLAWYRSLFAAASPAQLVGEDSTTYLASTLAPERVRRILPDVKLVFLLRDPVNRAYSHYWHLVRTGRAVFAFEHALRLAPELIVQRGLYRDQLERWLAAFPREQVHIAFFEDFVTDPASVINAVCTFLGLPPFTELPAERLHENRGGPIVTPAANRAFNWLLGHRLDRYGHPLTRPGTGVGATGSPGRRPAVRVGKWLTARLVRDYPPMARGTRHALEALYARANHGLADLIDDDVARRWPWSED